MNKTWNVDEIIVLMILPIHTTVSLLMLEPKSGFGPSKVF